jgi:hypothetical protein
MDFEYSDVTTRWRKWIVSAKSGTNLLRDTKMRREITLQNMLVNESASRRWNSGEKGVMGIYIPNEAIQHPNQPQHPSDRRVAPQTPPTKHHIQGKLSPGHQRRKQYQ